MRVRPAVIALAAVIWLLGISAGYYLIHVPSFAISLPFFAFSIIDVVVIGLLSALAGGVGTRLLPVVPLSPLARLALRAAFGLGVLGIGYLILGSAIGVPGWMAWSVVLLGLILLRAQMLAWLADLASVAGLWRAQSLFGRSLLLLLLVVLLAGLLVGIAPPLKYDALAYHLALPEQYIEIGRVSNIEENAYWGFPQLPHMLSTWALALGAQVGALVGWVFGVLAILGVAGFVAERLDTASGLVAAAALLAGSSLASSLAWAYVDWPTLLLGWAVLVSLWLWHEDGNSRWLLVAGLLAGFAFGGKYTAGLVALLAVIYLWIEERKWDNAFRFSTAALAAAAPWLLKNLLATGNPFYPLLLPGGAMDMIRLALYQGFPPQVGWVDLAALPLRATLWGIEGAHLGDAPGYEASIGPILLGLGVFAGVRRGQLDSGNRRLLRIATTFALGGLLGWALAGALSGHLIRTHLYYSLFAYFAVLAAFGFHALSNLVRTGWWFDWILQGIVLAALAIGAGAALSAVQAAKSETPYLRENLGLYALVMEYLNEELPADANVLMLWEARGYYCQPRCDSDELIDRWQHDIALYGSVDEVIAAWRMEGYSHVLYYRTAAHLVDQEPKRFHTFDLKELETALENLSMTQNFNDSYLLYSLEL